MNFKKQQLKGVEIHGDSQVGTRTVNILMGEHAGEYVRGDIMDANAVIQAFDELKGNVDTNHDTLEELVNEIHINSDKLAIVDGDSNTEGSFRKAISDVIAAAPEDLDTLKEIADKLAGNDDLHTALNQAITEKADASALANEVTRATGAESNLQAAIDTKQPKGNYLTEHQSLEEYAKKVELPTVPTKVSQLTNDSEFITKSVYDEKIAAIEARIAALETKHPETAA